MERDDNNLFWPASPSENDVRSDDDGSYNEEEEEEEERLLASALDSVVKIHATHSEPDFLIPWQKQHQTTSTR